MLGPAVFWFGVAEKVDYKRFSKCPGPCIARTWIKYTLVHCTGGIKILAGVEGVEPANAGIKIRCLNQLGDTPTQDSCWMLLLQVSYVQPTYNHFCYQPTRGWACKLLHLRTLKPSGWPEISISCGKYANTALPEPVIRPSSCLLVNQSSDCLICGQNS